MLVSTVAQARFILNSCPELTPLPFVNVHLAKDEDANGMATCLIAKEFAKVVKQISGFTKNYEILSLTIFHRYPTANYSDGGLIRIPERMIKRDIEAHTEVEKSLASTLNTFAHEYGHSILASRLKIDLREYRKFKIESKKIYLLEVQNAKLLEKSGELMIKLKEAIDSNNNISEKKIRKEMLELGVSFQEREKKIATTKNEFEKSKNTKRVVEISTSYHELFGDVIAAFYSNDPEAMYKAHTYPGISHENEVLALMRDFTSQHEVEGWDIVEPHGLLAPTRYFLWKNFWPTNSSAEKKRDFINNLYLAMLNEMSYRFRNKSSFTPKEINLRLMESIVKQFKK